MNQGIALLEEYRYLEAYQIFDGLARAHPDWEAAHVNKGIAALNLQSEYLKTAEESFLNALKLNPKNPHALVSLGILYHYTQKEADAYQAFEKALAVDPEDPYTLCYMGILLIEKGRVAEARATLEKVVKLQPSFATAYWRLREVYLKLGDRPRMSQVLEEFSRLDQAKAGLKVGLKYGEGGKYNMAMRDSAPPGWKESPQGWKAPEAPLFGPPVTVALGPSVVRARPDGKPLLPAFSVGDLNGDGTLDIVLCGQAAKGASSESKAPPVTATYRRGASGDYELMEKLPADGDLGVLADIDGDGDLDLVLAGENWLRSFQNDGSGKLAEKGPLVPQPSRGSPVRLYAVDADSDWDLDLVCLRQEKGDGGKIQSRVEILNNNRDGTFREISKECGIGPFDFAAAEMIVADLDGDLDLDILVLDGETGTASVFANDRVWRYRKVDLGPAAPKASGVVSGVVGDFDGDGRPDLAWLSQDSLRLWKNSGSLQFREDEAFRARLGSVGGTSGILADFQGSLSLSLLVLDGNIGNEKSRGAVFIASPDAQKALPVILEGSAQGGSPGGAWSSSGLVSAMGAGGPGELVVYDTTSGAKSYPLRAQGSWIALDLQGPAVPVPDKEHSNRHGVGALVEVRAGARRIIVEASGGAGGTARPSTRVYVGLRGASSADYCRVLWPDGVLQVERGLAGGQVHSIREEERKPSSCPIVFAWTGKDFEFVTDFLGVGGLGYLELPGVYSRPDPTEYVSLPELRPLDGSYRLEILEPLEECTYLDEVKLTVVDHPAGVTVVPEEMFAVRGPAPGFRLLAFEEKVFPLHAEDGEKNDVTLALREVDRRYGNSFQPDPRFPGLARNTHILELDFADRMAKLLDKSEKSAGPFLLLYGFVEYGYSTSNFAAWQAGRRFEAPSIRVERGRKWVTLRGEWGFPAGYPKYMAVDLEGLLERGDQKLRIDTNMDIRWDQAFLASAWDAQGASEPRALTVTELSVDKALLEFMGFPREESPDGSVPSLYVHGDFRPTAPFKVFPGAYTRYGEVSELLSASDDEFVVFGPGDGLRLSIDESRLPPLAPGQVRTFLLKANGYCKDMDLYTAHPESVDPLPFHAMSGYPYGPSPSRAEEPPPGRDAYRRKWNTRIVSGTLLDGFER